LESFLLLFLIFGKFIHSKLLKMFIISIYKTTGQPNAKLNFYFRTDSSKQITRLIIPLNVYTATTLQYNTWNSNNITNMVPG